MKLNNKGFAISSVIYLILVMVIILITLTLAILSSRKVTLDKLKDQVLNSIYYKKYENGEVVYFDVEKGTSCINYVEENSKTGYNGIDNKTGTQNSCLKFYAFNDDGSDKLNLILDHNTTAKAFWNSEGIIANGPKEVLEQLRIDTKDWKGTLALSNYTRSHSSGVNYTIDYDIYKARLITAGEIDKLTKNESFDIEFPEDFCANLDEDECNFGWLFDRTATWCDKSAIPCSNVSNIDTYGYWTSTSGRNDAQYQYAWYIHPGGRFTGYYVYSERGVRPVIEVFKNNLKEA